MFGAWIPVPSHRSVLKGLSSQQVVGVPESKPLKKCRYKIHISQCEMAGMKNGLQVYGYVRKTSVSCAEGIVSKQKSDRTESEHVEGAESVKGSNMSESQRGASWGKVAHKKRVVDPMHRTSLCAVTSVQLPKDADNPLAVDHPVDSVSPLFSFGVITDIQYADIPDGHSFLGTPRFYRHALDVLKRAVASWNNRERVGFAIHFGDLVDGYAKDESGVAFAKVLAEFNDFHGGSIYHMIGNHCLYNLSRIELNRLFSIPLSSDDHSYYEFIPHPGFRFVVLDGYDISVLGWPEEHPSAQLAVRLLDRINPNEDKNSPVGLEGDMARFVKFNGGLGKEQLAWLDHILRNATFSKEKVVICCHLPLHPGTLHSPSALCWNYTDVLDVLQKHPCVVACLSGHAHKGGYAIDPHGIHYVVLEAVLECPPGEDAFGVMDVFPDRLSLVGKGRMTSREMHFRTESSM